MTAQRVRWSVQLRRWSATMIVLVIAAIAVALIWQYYVTSPWTRDGRVRVLVANIAPEVSGKIVELRVADNEIVKKGAVLYVIDPFDYTNALDSAKTQVKQSAADLQVKQTQAKRRESLTSLAVSAEEQQQYAGSAVMAEATFASAQTALAKAERNLDRTSVRSPVNGYVTNLTLRVGDYAASGSPNIAVIDADSFWIDGYFEETKLARICVGDRVEAQLMGFSRPVLGRVQNFGRGISVSNAASSTQGLPDVDAVYTWVRLAQRVPVRVRIEEVPSGVLLASGLTATVRVRDPGQDTIRDRLAAAKQDVFAFFHFGPPRDRVCPEPPNNATGAISTLPVAETSVGRAPDQINPGLTPAMNAAPKASAVPSQSASPTPRPAGAK